MRALTLGQGVNSHAELPEVGMFHGLLGRDPLLGLVLQRGRQEVSATVSVQPETDQKPSGN